MKTFQIVLETVPEKCLTVEFPDGKDYFFESCRQDVRIIESPRDCCDPKEIPVFKYKVDGYIIKSVITEVTHTPMMEIELENGDILKFSWVDAENSFLGYVRLGNYFIDDPESDYPVLRFRENGTIYISMDDYTPINIYGDCDICTTPYFVWWAFEKYKVKRIQVVPETRPDEPMPYRQLGL